MYMYIHVYCIYGQASLLDIYVYVWCVCICVYIYIYCIHIYRANDVRVSDAFVVRYDADGG